MISKFIVIFLLISFFFYLIILLKFKRKKKVLKPKKLKILNKKNLNNWMNLTKKERYELAKQESFLYLDKRKLLLDEIRKEYKKISNRNSEENIEDK